MAKGGAHLPPKQPKSPRRSNASANTPPRQNRAPRPQNTEAPRKAPAADRPPRAERKTAAAPALPKWLQPRKRRRSDRFPLWPIVIVLSVVVVFAAWKLIDLLVGYRLDRAAYDALRDIAVVQLTPAPSPTPGADDEPPAETPPASEIPLAVDWDVLRQTNDEVIAWLYCPDTPINYPIVQAVDNEKYLNRSFEGATSAAGTIFADFNSVLHLRQSHFILYGHNMKDNSMFGTLKSYGDYSYYEKHPVLYLLSPDGNYRIELFAAQTIEALKANYPTYFSDEGAFSSYLAQMTAGAYWVNAEYATTEYQIITLSTCTSSDSERLILQGRLVPIQ